MSQPMWVVRLLKKYFPKRFAIAELTKKPVLGKVMDEVLFKNDNILYLPKDRVVVNQAIQPENVMLPSEVVDHFIRQASHRWIMSHCICRDAAHCKDYPIELGCVFLGEPVTRINPQLGRLASLEETLAHVQRCREAGLFHMIGRDRLDTLWLGTFPGQRLLTICNCCPCCCLFKIMPNLNAEINTRVTRMPGVTLTVAETCIGCGKCTKGACFVNAIHLGADGRAFISDDCRGCGHCVEVCPTHSIELHISESNFVEESIRKLSGSVDIR